MAAAASFLAACSSGSTSPTSAPAVASPSASTSASSPVTAGSPAAASSANAPTTVDELAGYTGADRQQILEAGAQKEGHLTWYTSLAGPVVDALVAGFKAKYPAVQVDYYRGADDDLITKSTQEAQAGQQNFDVIESPPDAIDILSDAGILTHYYSPALAQMPADTKDDASGNEVLGTTVRVSLLGFGYNTTLLPDSDVPKTMQDLLNPNLAGKLALTGTTTGYRWVGAVLQGMGDTQGQQFLSQFASQQKPPVQQVSAQALLDLIAKGEIAASPTIFRDHVLEAQNQQQAPVKWVALDPVMGNAGEAGMALKSPHPNAALLFIDYLLTDGQDVLKQYFYAPAAEQEPFQVWIPEAGRSVDQIQSDAKGWSSLFQQDFRQ